VYPVEATLHPHAAAVGGAGVDTGADALAGSLLGLAGTGEVEHVSVLADDPDLLRAVLFVRAERALGAEQAARVALGQWCDRVGGVELVECSALLDTAPRASTGRG
jgi:hypothetical protein